MTFKTDMNTICKQGDTQPLRKGHQRIIHIQINLLQIIREIVSYAIEHVSFDNYHIYGSNYLVHC
jgi:hypothetical protein